jgi:hypothetical protein
MSLERRPRSTKPNKLVKMHPFWIQPELIERLHAVQSTVSQRVDIQQPMAEILRRVIAMGLEAYEQRLKA